MLLLWTVAVALAEDPVFAGTAAPVKELPPEPEAHLSAELGGSASGGNTSFYTVSSTVNGSYQASQNKVGLILAGVYGRGRVDADASGSLDEVEQAAKPVETARRATADLRYDRFFGEVNSLYGLVGALYDPFAGYDLRTHEQLGYSRLLVKTEKTELAGELGFDVAQENYVDGVDPNRQSIYAAREMVRVTTALGDVVGITEQLEVYENVVTIKDVRVLNTIAVSFTVSKALSFKVGNTLIFDNVPVEGFGKLDQTTTATLVANLL